MSLICNMIAPDCVLLDLEAGSKEDVIQVLVDVLAKAGHVADTKLLFKDVMTREALASTGLGYGCAVPHAHSAALDKTVLAVARLKTALDFNAPDGLPVRLVFLMAGPKDSAGLHLKLLSKLARLLHDNSLRGQLMDCPSIAVFQKLLCERDN